jgi:hypothetical protein
MTNTDTLARAIEPPQTPPEPKLEPQPQPRTVQVASSGKWAVASDGTQWILQKRRGTLDPRTGQPQWHGVSFVSSTRDILARCMREKGTPPEDAARLLAACGERFSPEPVSGLSHEAEISLTQAGD